MREITRRAALFAASAIGAVVSTAKAVATPTDATVEAWEAQLRKNGYWIQALVFERPDGILVVEPINATYHIASPGKRLGGCAYFAPQNMEVTLNSRVRVPASLLAAALAIPTAHAEIQQHSQYLLNQTPYQVS